MSQSSQRLPVYKRKLSEITDSQNSSSCYDFDAECSGMNEAPKSEGGRDSLEPTPSKSLKLERLSVSKENATPTLPPPQNQEFEFKTPKDPASSKTFGSALSSAGRRTSVMFLSPDQVNAFVRFMEMDEVITKFLRYDYCRNLTDPYLLGMTFVYFRRLRLPYSRLDFFALLYLANDMEEDREEHRFEILPWALGPRWYPHYHSFYHRRDELFRMLDHRAIVSKKFLDEIFRLSGHPIWSVRYRHQHHEGALRTYNSRFSEEDYFPKGPCQTPLMCTPCVDALDLANLPTGLRKFRFPRQHSFQM